MKNKEIVLITGASGLVGAQAVNYCLEEGCKVVATDLNFPAYDLLKKWIESTEFRFIQADLRDKKQLERIIVKYLENNKKPITVLHIGGVFDYLAPEKLLFDVNVGGTENLFETLKPVADKIKRLVIWSGGVVYGSFDFELPARETSPVNPQNTYGRSKLEQERIAFLLGKYLKIPVTAMRSGAIYGPRSKYGMGSCIFLYANGQLSCFVFGSGKNRVALVHALDTVRAALFLSQKTEAVGEVYNVADDFPYSMMKMATFLGKELNNPVYQRFRLPKFVFEMAIREFEKAVTKLKLKPIVDPESANMLKADNWMSNKKIKALGFEFKYTDSFVGLKETIAWYRKEDWI